MVGHGLSQSRAGVRRVVPVVVALVAFALAGVVGAPPAQAVPNRAYVPNNLANTVSVIDTTTNTVVATIGVGDAPVGVAVSPDGTRAYVTNFNSDTVSVIDTATNTVVDTPWWATGPPAWPSTRPAPGPT